MVNITTAKLFLGNATGFHQAAERMVSAGGVNDTFPWPPFFMCLGYTFELSLKAYLLHKGESEKRCQRKIGHDLDEALAEAEKRGMGKLPSEVTQMISSLGKYHKNHTFRYMKPVDVASLPDVAYALSITQRHLCCIASQLPELLP